MAGASPYGKRASIRNWNATARRLLLQRCSSVIQEIAALHGTTWLEIMSYHRSKVADAARRQAMREIQRREQVGPSVVAYVFHRNHATVIQALKDGRVRGG